MVGLALTGGVARVGIGAIVVDRTAARKPSRPDRMRADPVVAGIAGAGVAVVRACRPIRLVVQKARSRTVARVGIGAIRVCRAATRRAEGLGRVRALPVAADIVAALIAVIRAGYVSEREVDAGSQGDADALILRARVGIVAVRIRRAKATRGCRP